MTDTVALVPSASQVHIGEEVTFTGEDYTDSVDVWLSFLNQEENEMIAVNLGNPSGGDKTIDSSGTLVWAPEGAGIWTIHAKQNDVVMASCQVEVFTS